MASYQEQFKQYDRASGKWVTRSIERNMTPKKADVHRKAKIRKYIKEDPFIKSIFEA